jgi:hypothetical protein
MGTLWHVSAEYLKRYTVEITPVDVRQANN